MGVLKRVPRMGIIVYPAWLSITGQTLPRSLNSVAYLQLIKFNIPQSPLSVTDNLDFYIIDNILEF
jgi:hypothetical protein